MFLSQLMAREDAPNKNFEVGGKRRRHFVFFPEAM
jgi:hypothetical protein